MSLKLVHSPTEPPPQPCSSLVASVRPLCSWQAQSTSSCHLRVRICQSFTSWERLCYFLLTEEELGAQNSETTCSVIAGLHPVGAKEQLTIVHCACMLPIV